MAQPQRRAAVTWNRDGAVVEIVLDSPPANALGLEIVEGLHAAMDYAEAAGAKVIMVMSAVNGFFAAGADIKHMSAVDAGIVPGVRRRVARRAGTPRRPAHGLRGRHRRARAGRRSRVGDGVHDACRRRRGAARSSRGQTRPDPRRVEAPSDCPVSSAAVAHWTSCSPGVRLRPTRHSGSGWSTASRARRAPPSAPRGNWPMSWPRLDARSTGRGAHRRCRLRPTDRPKDCGTRSNRSRSCSSRARRSRGSGRSSTSALPNSSDQPVPTERTEFVS